LDVRYSGEKMVHAFSRPSTALFRRIFWALAGLLAVLLCDADLCGQGKSGKQGTKNDNTRQGSDDNGEFGAVSTTIQLPTLGVAVNAEGVLEAKSVADPRGDLIQKRIEIAKKNLPADLHKRSKLRKVSLRRLEAALDKRIAAGQTPTEAMMFLAGLVRANYVFVDQKSKDIIIAGPAEPWVQNPADRIVGVHSNLPTLRLEDLVAAMRAFRNEAQLKKWVAVSIEPTVDGLEKLKAFQATIPKQIPQNQRAQAAIRIASGLQESLGNARIKVYGISRKTHLAHVLIESDYRMKMLGIGLEPKPVKMITFLDALTGAPRNMQRWWLVPNYECVVQAPDESAIQLVGQGVKLSTADISFDEKARIVHTGRKPSKAATKYANSFTKNYDRISEVRPVFAQLRNAIDLLVLSAWISKTKAYERVGWKPDLLFDEDQLEIQVLPDPLETPCLANAVWKGQVLVAPAGGGVSIMASEAFSTENMKIDRTEHIVNQFEAIEMPADEDIWWWD